MLGDHAELKLYRRGVSHDLSVHQVKDYKTPVYISDKAHIKPKALHEINQNTEKAMSKWGVDLKEKPKIVIVSDEELNNALGLYDACDNVVYYAESLAKKAVQEKVGGSGVVEAHEMWHLKQADDFRKNGWIITRDNHPEYLQVLNKKCKKHIEKLGVTSDNVEEISKYASDMYIGDRFDEVEADYMALRRRNT